ncbi:hypothetical protein H6B15_06485 [Gemmiger formicilis]|uniref:hypothetical protein n=1 Tax=Gemmiger formicilis TaxID=745368 RepID=UPI00195CFE2D|nr:hypothetical protein [Gemmiger formicilis]MBM6716305.1 hypothetical protein [Gemmiger formicilis]
MSIYLQMEPFFIVTPFFMGSQWGSQCPGPWSARQRLGFSPHNPYKDTGATGRLPAGKQKHCPYTKYIFLKRSDFFGFYVFTWNTHFDQSVEKLANFDRVFLTIFVQSTEKRQKRPQMR